MKIATVEDLENELSRPSDTDYAAMERLDGDLIILGAAGKMGPSLARLCRRAADEAGRPRRVFAVSRRAMDIPGVESIVCDLARREQVAMLPDCPNVLYLAGRKFGSTDRPDLTWAMNTLVPSLVAERFRSSRIVVFSTGNVYPLRDPSTGGSKETDPPDPVGEYAQTCLGRERVFEYHSREHALRCLFFRLNYAVDLRYGVPVDIAGKVFSNEAVSLKVPAFNVIWQPDANSYALRSLDLCQTPPKILNITGPEICFVRETAEYFASRFGRPCRFAGDAGTTALLSDASLSHALLGPPQVSAVQLMERVANWLAAGGTLLNKPTRFEVENGRF